jgi:NAD(P)-dependent dehydrogenase (short-subunit alcohol dehydrogenase family)
VYIGCRSAQRANDAIEEIKKGGTRKITGQFEYIAPDPATVGTIEYLNLDLGDLDSVEKCANEFIEKVPKLDLYFANAGIMATDPGDHTTQGYPLQFGTNVSKDGTLVKSST